ncbi:MAG: alpha/beta fold hydrolase [Burkholderiales bacterium]
MSAGERLPGTPEPMFRWPGAGGITLAGDAWGDAAAPLVLLLHGGGQTRHAWKNVGRVLGDAGFRAIAFDARGHGDSDWAPDGRYGTDVMIDDLLALLHALGNPRPALVGASMGGGTSLCAIGEDRIDATALVMVDIAPRIEPSGVANIRAFMERDPNGFASLAEVADAIAAYQPHRRRPRNLAGLAKNVRLGADGRYRWHWDPRFREARRSLSERQQRFEAATRRLLLPVMIVRGGMSDVVTEEGVQEFLALCPQAEYANVGSAGHMVAGDRNDAFGSAVVDFLQRKAPMGAAGHAARGGPALPHDADLSDVP